MFRFFRMQDSQRWPGGQGAVACVPAQKAICNWLGCDEGLQARMQTKE